MPALVLAASPGRGFIEICKEASGPGVSGRFEFVVNGLTVSVPVGACSPALELPAGTATVTEVARPGMLVTDISTSPAARLISRDLAARSATVAVAEGNVSTQTTVIFTNAFETGQLKVCKVAGEGVAEGTNVIFNVDGQAVNVPAGPAPDGSAPRRGSSRPAKSSGSPRSRTPTSR